MFRVFCNKCYVLINTKEHKKFFISSCSHVFCEICIQNYKNFCIKCKCLTKMLEINENLPASVKQFLDPCSFTKKVEEAERIHQFQTSQIKLFISKYSENRMKYIKVKAEMEKLVSIRNKLKIDIDQETKLIEKLKNAYKSGNISSDLFQISSPSIPLPPRALDRSANRKFQLSSQEYKNTLDKLPETVAFSRGSGPITSVFFENRNKMQKSNNLQDKQIKQKFKKLTV